MTGRTERAGSDNQIFERLSLPFKNRVMEETSVYVETQHLTLKVTGLGVKEN